MQTAMKDPLLLEAELVRQIPAVPTVLEVVSKLTGMGFVTVARVTEDRWIACEVLDNIDFGLKPNSEVRVESTICHEVRLNRAPIAVDDISCALVLKGNPSTTYAFKSYVSMPIMLSDGSFFGNLCAVDPRPLKVNTPEIIGMFKLFAELLAVHIEARAKLIASDANLAISQALLATSRGDLLRSEASLATSQGDLLRSETNLATSQADLLDAQEASELREQFIAVLGHDLRNPLAAISGGTALLLKREPTEKQKTVLLMMTASVQRMNSLIGNLMDFARGRLGGGLTLESETKLLTPTLEQVVDEIRSAWPDRIIETDFHLDEPVTGDHPRIGQLFSNLLGNAITHGAADKPITVEAVNNDAGLRLSVCNAGVPISAAARERLFQPFYRGEVRSSLQGLGLGLFIVSEIARAHGGSMNVTSDDEHTCFTLTIPTDSP